MNKASFLKFRYGLLLRLSRFFNRSFLAPVEVLITLTNRCNLKCIMCSFHNYPMDIKDELSTKDIISMLDQIKILKIGNITFSGGEPLLRDDIFEIIHYASRLGLNTTLLTNGTIVNDGMVKKIKDSGLNSIWVSIDGLEDVHDSIRGKGSFTRSINFIKIIKEECPAVSLNIATTVMNNNLEDIPKLLQLWEKMKINQVSLQPVIPDNTDWNNKSDNDVQWVPEHRFAVLDKVIGEIIDFKKNKGIINNDFAFIHLIKSYFRKDLGKAKRQLYCYEGFKRFTITSGGRLWICGTEMKLNIVKHGLNKCWNASEVRKKRREMLQCKQTCLQACSFE